MFDPVCKFLVESFPTDFATWLLGEPVELTELSPTELLLEPIRTDALILLQSENLVLHLEFQTQPKPEIPFRMLDYRIRVYRRFPSKQMRQVVIYLQPTRSDLVQQTNFSLENTNHQFEVIRLWEQPAESFLQFPGLLPFAVLGQTEDQTQVLQQVAQSLEQISDSRIQSNLLSSAYILAGLVLDRESISRILRRELMQESVTYQEILEEGLEQGLERGRIQERQQMVINLLQEEIAVDIITRVTGLSVEQIQQIQSAQASEEPNNA